MVKVKAQDLAARLLAAAVDQVRSRCLLALQDRLHQALAFHQVKASQEHRQAPQERPSRTFRRPFEGF